MRIGISNIVGKIKKHKIFSFCSIIVFSYSLFFVAGAMHPSTKIEKTASYLADVAEKYTINSKYLGLKVESKSDNSSLLDSVNEFNFLYGRFREKAATFASAVNADKKHKVYIKDIDEENNYSFLNNDHGFSSIPYNNHFKHDVYPLELLFSGNEIKGNDVEKLPNAYDRYCGFLYPSQSIAKKIIMSKGLDDDGIIDESDYRKILGKRIDIIVDEKIYFFWIKGIYLETNYYYDALNEIMGNFLFSGGFPKDIMNKQSIYFLRNYTFQNKYFIDYIIENYDLNNFSYNVLTNNLNHDFLIDNSKLIFSNSESSFYGIFFSIISCLFLIGDLIFYFFAFKFNRKHIFLTILFVLLPYFIFWIVNIFTNSVAIFSSFSTIFYFCAATTFIAIYLLLSFSKKKRGVIDDA